jgi:transcriptional regulator with XRE-family HTH domain
MAWKEVNIEELARSLGVNVVEVREKQKISQATFAKKMGVTQSRIAQVESGVGTSKVTFDVLLGILGVLGYDFKILPRKAARQITE